MGPLREGKPLTDKKKSRLSMLDSLAAAGAGSPPPSMMASNRALRSARDAVDSHNVWDLDPSLIRDDRMRDRLELGDLTDLRRSIETNGQSVPILVRRDPKNPEKYILVYGLRRLTAIRESETVTKVKALVTNLSFEDSIKLQATENADRRDLSFMEKALFAKGLMDTQFGTQDSIAEILNVPKSWVSMSKNILTLLGPSLPKAIGAAPGVGRPRWETLAKTAREHFQHERDLVALAKETRERLLSEIEAGNPPDKEPSLIVFETVERAVMKKAKGIPRKTVTTDLVASGQKLGRIKRTPKGLTIDLDDRTFALWLQRRSDEIFTELHARYKKRGSEPEQ